MVTESSSWLYIKALILFSEIVLLINHFEFNYLVNDIQAQLCAIMIISLILFNKKIYKSN